MSLASDIPVRSNGTEMLAGWFNTIRTVLVSMSGMESKTQTSFSGASGQSGTNVTGLVFDETVSRRAEIPYTIVTATKVESGVYIALFDGSDWFMFEGPVEGVDSAITLDISVIGQVIYDSGAETFTLQYKATTFNL